MIKIYGTCIVEVQTLQHRHNLMPIALEMNRIYPKGSYVTTQYEMQLKKEK